MFMRRDTPLDAPLYQAPLIVVQYMLLYYISNLARYNGLEWQELLVRWNVQYPYTVLSLCPDVIHFPIAIDSTSTIITG